MHILLVHRYYWPDTPAYAQMLHIMARRFVEDGHTVSVFSTQPGYNETKFDKAPGFEVADGVQIYRTPLLKESKKTPIIRALNVMVFCASLFLHCIFRWGRYEVMTVASFPPTVMGLMARVICFFTRSKYVFHCQDLYPEVAKVSGLMKRKWVGKIAAANDRRNCRKAAAVVVLSEDMKQTVANRNVPVDNVRIINNFIIDKLNPDADVIPELARAPDKFRVLFAGNIGRFQNLDMLIDAAKLLSDQPQIELLFVGGGAMIDKLKTQAGELLGKSIRFEPFQPLESVMRVVHESDLSIVSLTPGVIHCAYPSKTMTYVEAGCRMLAIIEEDSELARLIETEDLGVVCGNPTPEKIAAAIRAESIREKSGGAESGRVREIGNRHFGQPMILDKWSALMRDLEK